MSKNEVKIFVGYHKPHTVFKSDVFQPILTADVAWDNPDVIRDDSGTNIAEKNKNYGELTGHYWVWKNFLPKTEAKYVGFCHYRRFFDFNMHQTPNVPFMPILATDFEKTFKNYTEENILKCIGDYDIVLTHKYKFEEEILVQYMKYHPGNDINLALNAIKDFSPEYYFHALKFITSKEMYACLQFVMKKELMEEYMQWMFGFLNLLEERSDWSKYDEYMTVRMPAYIAERFFNVWLDYNVAKRGLKVLESSSYLLTGKDYGQFSYEEQKQRYDFVANSELYKPQNS